MKMRLQEKVKEITMEFAATEKMKKSQRKKMEGCAESRGFVENRADRFYKAWSADHSITIEAWMHKDLTDHMEYL